MGFEIGTDVVIISLNIALSLSSSKAENRLRTPLASVVLVCISQGRFLSTSRNLSTLCSRVPCSSGRFTGSDCVEEGKQHFSRTLPRIFLGSPSLSCTFSAIFSLTVFIGTDSLRFPLKTDLLLSFLGLCFRNSVRKPPPRLRWKCLGFRLPWLDASV